MVEMSLFIRATITPTNQTPVFNLVTWILEVTTLFAVTLKVALLQTSIGLHLDDWFVLAAAVLSIGQVIAASFQSFNGVGRPQASLSQSNIVIYQKAGYAGEIQFILALLASKLSVSFFLYHVSPFDSYRRITIGVGAFVTLWSLASLFATAFQCHDPHKWAFVQGRCINLTAFWTSYASINIVTELALIIVPLHLFYKNISDLSRRIILMICFSLRLVVVVSIAVQIYFLHHPVHPNTSSVSDTEDDDFTFTTWPVFLTTQVIQSLSIITTCMPFMKTLLVGLETGMFQTGQLSARNLSVNSSRRTNRVSRQATDDTNWRAGSISSVSNRLIDNDSVRTASLQQQMSQDSAVRRGSESPFRNFSRSGSITWADGPRSGRSRNQREVSMIQEEEEGVAGDRLSRFSRNSVASRHRYVLDVNIPSSRLLLPDVDGEEQ